MYNYEKLIEDAGGKEYIKNLIEEEGITYPEIRNLMNIPKASGITCKNIVNHCNAVIPFPKVSNRASRKWMIRWCKFGSTYWQDDYLTEQIYDKLTRPILNKAGKSERYNISMWGHPSANKDSYQIRAHQVIWELNNECFLPKGYEVYPINDNFLNLDFDNFSSRTTTERLSLYSSGERNYFYTGTPRYVNYTRGWNRISKEYKMYINNICEICSNTEHLNTHHIISYWLFSEEDKRVHSFDNLLCVCDVCHGHIHQRNKQIVPHISVTKYKKLLELLESLKSQVPNTLMETYKDVEKQLGLTDNQQLST